MIRYSNGEARVIDLTRKLASEFLHHSDQDAPLSEYELDHDLTEADLSASHVVVREEP
jgi:hypothetical protein